MKRLSLHLVATGASWLMVFVLWGRGDEVGSALCLLMAAFGFSIMTLLSIPDAWRERCRGMKARSNCVRCKYDLTGNVSGVCPECGMEIV